MKKLMIIHVIAVVIATASIASGEASISGTVAPTTWTNPWTTCGFAVIADTVNIVDAQSQGITVSGTIGTLPENPYYWLEVGLVPKFVYDSPDFGFLPYIFNKGVTIYTEYDGTFFEVGLLKQLSDPDAIYVYPFSNNGSISFSFTLAPSGSAGGSGTLIVDGTAGTSDSASATLTYPQDLTESYLVAMVWVDSGSLDSVTVSAEVLPAPTEVWVDDDYCTTCNNDGHIWGYDAFDNIQDGIDAVAGSTVNVAAGTYNESITIDKSLSIIGAGASSVFITGGIVIGDSFDGLTLEGLTLSGDAPNPPGQKNAVIDSRPTTGPVSNITVRSCILDGENASGRMAFYGHFITGTWTFDDNEIKNFPLWYVIDNTGSSFDAPYKLSHVVFTNNYIHDVAGSIAFRGKMGDEIETAVVSGNLIDYSMISHTDSQCWAAIEINKVLDLKVYENKVLGVPESSWLGEGQAFQFWSLTPWTVDIHDNEIANCYEGIFFVDVVSPYSCYIPSGSVNINSFHGNSEYAVSVGSEVPDEDEDPLDALYNWWGDVSGPDHDDSWLYGALEITNPDGLGDAVSNYVLYSPWTGQGGLVTGGGTILSDAGDYRWDMEAAGEANFGFVSKYKKGKNVPDGNTNFVFEAGDFHFHSSSYEWLVVAGETAKFKGTGTIEGHGDGYKFMLWAGDSDTDTFRIKVWEETDNIEDVVYDNGSQDPITGGSIVIHKGKK